MSAYGANSIDAAVGVPQPLCILIVDRDVDAAQRLGELLEHLGHDVDFAYSLPAGLDAARRLRPDVMFVDASLNGAGRLRVACARDDVFVVALGATAAHDGSDAQLAKSPDRQALSRLLELRRPKRYMFG